MAGIANFGSFAGGLMQGHRAALDEQRREEDQAFQRENQQFQRDSQSFLAKQRAEAIEEMARQKRLREGIAGLARPGAELGRTSYMMEGIDGPEVLPGAYTINRQTDQGFLRGLADLYYREGMPEQAVGVEERMFNLGQRERTLGHQRSVDAALSRRAEMIREAQADPTAFMAKYAPQFNADAIGGPQYAGHTVALASTPKGQVAYMVDPSGKNVGSVPINARTLTDFIDSLTDADLSAASPEMYGQVATRGIQRGQLGAQQMTAAAALQNAVTNEAYKTGILGRPTLTPDGTGRILVTDPQGNLLRTLGNPRPVPGGGGGGGARQLPPAMVKELNEAAAAVDAAKTPAERMAAQQKYNNLYSIAATIMGKVLRPGEIKGNYAGTRDENPRVAALQQQASQLESKMTGDNFEATQAALAKIDQQIGIIRLGEQVKGLSAAERVPEASKLIQQGASPEVLQGLGFSQDEVRAARKYRPPAQPSAATATNPTAKPPRTGDGRVSNLTAEEAALPVGERVRLGLDRARGPSTTGTDTRSVTERLFGQ